MKKFLSRKFVMCFAAFLGSISASISGLVCGNEKVQAVGIVCGIISAAIYAAAEAYVDAKAIEKEEY